MTHIFLNGLGANAGAGLTYLYNVVPRLDGEGIPTTLAVQPQLRQEFHGLKSIRVLDVPVPQGTLARFWFEQAKLPALIEESGADVLLSAGNFALRRSPVPQILLSGNSLYTSKHFYRDLLRRRELGLWIDTRAKGFFARKSVQWADCTVAPSQAFAEELACWSGKRIEAIHHGFDRDIFFADAFPLPDRITEKLTEARNCLKLLFVSHYNYYRNFETLFRAVAFVRDRLSGERVRLFLTCSMDDRSTRSGYKTSQALREIENLGIRGEVVELGAVPYRQLHHLYRACDVYVTPAYTETFAHPLVEAMASGLPVVASDIPVHHEVCGRAALYFPPFAPDVLAQMLLAATELSNRPRANPAMGRFSWADHLQALLALASVLTRTSENTRPDSAQCA